MGIELIASVALGALTTFFRVLLKDERFQLYLEWMEQNTILGQVFKQLGIRIPKEHESYQQRASKLINKLSEISIETEAIIDEFENIVQTRKQLVEELEGQHQTLTSKLEQIKNDPEYATLQIQTTLTKMEKDQEIESKKSALRDYLLYILGVLTPFLISWLASLFGIQIPGF